MINLVPERFYEHPDSDKTYTFWDFFFYDGDRVHRRSMDTRYFPYLAFQLQEREPSDPVPEVWDIAFDRHEGESFRDAMQRCIDALAPVHQHRNEHYVPYANSPAEQRRIQTVFLARQAELERRWRDENNEHRTTDLPPDLS